MFYTSQRTIYGHDLQLAQLVGADYNILDNTSLNQHLHVEETEKVPKGIYPKLKYFCLGIGGNGLIEDNSNYPYTQHSPIDANLFNLVPLICREESIGFTSSEYKKYRLITTNTYNGKRYLCAYLKVIDTIEYTDTFQQISRRSGVDSLDYLTLDTKNPLNPTPISKVGKITSNNSNYVTKIVKTIIELTTNELQEIKNAITLVNGSLVNITEMGLVSGLEKTGNKYNEAVCTQICYHVSLGIDIELHLNTESSFYRSIDIGGIEPLYLQ